MPIVEYYPGMEYGLGIDKLSGNIRGEGVIRTAIEEVTGAQGQTISFNVEQVDTVESFKTSMGVGANVDVTFPAFTAGASFNFAQSCAMNSFSVWLTVVIQVSNSTRQMRDVKLRPEALDLLKNGQEERFRKQFGDYYIDAMITGGSLRYALEITTTSDEQKQDISASLRASAVGGAYKLDAQFAHSVEQASSKTALTVRGLQQGGKNTRQPTTASEIIAKAQDFPSEVVGDWAVVNKCVMIDYETLDMPTSPNKIDLQNARDILEDCYSLSNKLERLRNDHLYCLVNQNQFVNPEISKINSVVNETNECIKNLRRAASRAMDYPLEAEFPHIDVPESALPPRKSKGSIPRRTTPAGPSHIAAAGRRREVDPAALRKRRNKSGE